MENFDHILLFKTNLGPVNCDWLQELLDQQAGIAEWNLDLDDEDRVLRIISKELTHKQIIQLMTNHGFECCELT